MIITRLIARPVRLTCFLLIVALATATTSAQRPPDESAGPSDKSRDRAAEKKDDFRPGLPARPGLGPQWSGPGARGRASAAGAPARLDALEAKLDTLLDEVRQLRREIQRLRTTMQPSMSGRKFGPPFYPGAPRGAFGPGAAWAPRGPHWNTPPGAFGPPWGGPGRGPQAMRDRAFRAPRDEHINRGPGRPRGDDLQRGPAGPHDEPNIDRRPDDPRDERDDTDRDRPSPRRDREDPVSG